MADRLLQELARAREHVDPAFQGAQVERGLSALEGRLVRRARRMRALRASAGACALLLALWGAYSLQNTGAPQAQLRDGVLETHDGSRASVRSADAELALTRDADDEVALTLKRGKGHFEVTRNPRRRYRVHAGDVDVQVLGTAFDVERVGARTRVQVEHGVVRVRWRSGERTLYAGQGGLFPEPLPPIAAQETAPRAALEPPRAEPAPEVSEATRVEPAPEPRAHERWRALARAGKHQEAFGSLGQAQVDDLAGLLLAADAARLSGHPLEAARYLERLIARYPNRPQAHLAAFTLGRLALYELKQPALAARSFERAYALNTSGPLAEDALAREAEAYHRAGDAQRAKAAAERYLQRYPEGARRAEMVGYVGAGP